MNESANRPDRPYDQIAEQVSAAGDRTARMRTLIDLLWKKLSPLGVSWIGFYLHERDDELVLGPSRNKPACSPIGMHGACGQAFRSGKPLVVRDVRSLGEGYVACDPRDLSEVVIPVFDETGRPWGVLDADSFDTAAFDQRDVDGLLSLLRKTDLTPSNQPTAETDVV